MVRLPPRRLHRLPRDRAGRGRARSCSGSSAGRDGRDRVRRPRSSRCSPPPTSAGCSSSPRSRARRGATTASTTATASTSSRCGSSGSSSGSPSGPAAPPSSPAAIGAVAALALPLILPFRQLANEAGIDTVPGALWVRIEAELAGPGPASGRLALGCSSSSRSSPRPSSCRDGSHASRSRAVVAISFAATSYFAWERMIDAPEDLVFAGGLERAWIDDAAPGRRARDEALRRHELRLRARAARALPHGVLQLDRRPRRLRRRLRPGRAADRARRRGAVGPARALAGDRSSRTTSSRSGHRARRPTRSPREQPPGSCSGRSEVPCASSAPRSNAAAAPDRLRLAHAAEVAARVEGDEELLALAIDLELVASRRGTSRSPRAGPGSRSLRICPMFESSTIR